MFVCVGHVHHDRQRDCVMQPVFTEVTDVSVYDRRRKKHLNSKASHVNSFTVRGVVKIT